MKTYRRDFLKLAGLAGAGLLSSCTNVPKTVTQENANTHDLDKTRKDAKKKYAQQFNMSGYCAPKIETVRIGFIGTGCRGTRAVERMSYLESVQIKGIWLDIVTGKQIGRAHV